MLADHRAGEEDRVGSVVDVAVVGGGPAGMAAAAAAADAGLTVAIVDAGSELGGQYWRHPRGADTGLPRAAIYRRLAASVRAGVLHLADHEVWLIERSADAFVVHAVHHSAERTLQASAVVLATGAIDRQLPFPGWDLPGVYTAGGAQALLKEHAVPVGTRVAVAGTGPFLLPVAAELIGAGAGLAGVFEAAATTGWLRHPMVLAGHGSRIREAASYRATLIAAGARYRTQHAVVSAHGTGEVEAVTVTRVDARWNPIEGTAQTIACDALAVGWGFTPRVELAVELGCATETGADGSVVVKVDDDQAASVPGVYVAGELCGVGGARLALAEGEIAGSAAASALQSRPSPTVASARRDRGRGQCFAAAMHAVHAIRDGWCGWLRPDTVVCRCEEIPVSAVRAAVGEFGAADTRMTKVISRAGMGWCQGRICAFAVSRIAAAEGGGIGGEAGLVRRPLAVPVTLGMLAGGVNRGALPKENRDHDPPS